MRILIVDEIINARKNKRLHVIVFRYLSKRICKAAHFRLNTNPLNKQYN